MIKKTIQAAALLTALALLASLCGCGSQTATTPSLNADMPGRQNTFTFSSPSSETLTLSDEGAASVLSVIRQQQADYAYEGLYEMDEVKQRLDFDASVAAHQFSALNAAGELEAGHLASLVEKNNGNYLAQNKFGYQAVEEDYLLTVCDFIVQVTSQMRDRYPDIDWQRVYCNLGNLKILYDVGMLSYAQVSKEMVLSISKNNTEIILNMKGEDGFSRVLTHEIMHIIQIGCVCEEIGHCERRAGISVYWDDFPRNTADWTWFVEGAAERNMCNLTGGEAISYQYKMDYLCSFTMSVLLRNTVRADTMETICFYSDPELLFDAFGCETQDQRDEILNMMITMEVLQSQPDTFFEAYTEIYGVDPRNDEEMLNQFCYSLKPAVCVTLAKEFYENLISFLQENQLACNDLFFLLNLFEGHVNQHLNYTNESKAQINEPFISSYTTMRSALFRVLETDNPELDLAARYADYSITAAEGLLNADLSMLPEEKREFLSERAQWMDELNGLGQKVPTEQNLH